jgi:alpha-D-ribose 1-methylphosphonate 5-triphosphate synthase subunit PhnG
MSGVGASEPSANAETTLTRRRWLAVLAKARVGDLEAAWASLADKPRYRVLRRAETGLVMMRGRIGGTGQPFNFGEMTMTRAAVQLLDDANDASRTGFGHVAGRSARHAELVTLFDALLQDPELPIMPQQSRCANAPRASDRKVRSVDRKIR